MDITSETRLSQVDPVLEKKVHIAVAQIVSNGLSSCCTSFPFCSRSGCALRQGKDGTQRCKREASAYRHECQGGYSSHNFVWRSILSRVLGKVVWTPNWDAEDPAYGNMASACKAAGLKWGGDWIISRIYLTSTSDRTTQLTRCGSICTPKVCLTYGTR